MHKLFWQAGSVVIMSTVIAAMVGCGGNSDTEENADNSAQRSPYSTPDSVIDAAYNATRPDTLDYPGFLALIYAENATQQEILSLLNRLSVLYELVGEAGQRFGDDFDISDMPTPIEDMPVIVTREDRRAIAEYRSEGKVRELHLVEYDNRWWISGYTFENDPDFDVNEMQEATKAVEVIEPTMRNLLTRLRNNEFADGGEFTAAMMASMFEVMMKHPELHDMNFPF